MWEKFDELAVVHEDKSPEKTIKVESLVQSNTDHTSNPEKRGPEEESKDDFFKQGPDLLSPKLSNGSWVKIDVDSKKRRSISQNEKVKLKKAKREVTCDIYRDLILDSVNSYVSRKQSS